MPDAPPSCEIAKVQSREVELRSEARDGHGLAPQAKRSCKEDGKESKKRRRWLEWKVDGDGLRSHLEQKEAGGAAARRQSGWARWQFHARKQTAVCLPRGNHNGEGARA